MKKLIVALTVSLTCLGAFAQGKISFQTDSLHLAYYANTAPQDAALASNGVSSVLMPLGVTLVADLYLGTDSHNLLYWKTTSFSTTPGKWNTANVSSGANGAGPAGPTPPGGTVVNVIAVIRDGSLTPPPTLNPDPVANAYGTYFGESAEFQFTLGTSAIAYPQMWSASGNWPAGTFPMSGPGIAAGSEGAIGVSPVPEPATFALAGLGAAALLIFRRRK